MKQIRKRCRIYFDESKIYSVLKIINKHCREHIKMRLIVGNCEELDSPSIWYAHLVATDYEWALIKNDLKEVETVIVTPDSPKELI